MKNILLLSLSLCLLFTANGQSPFKTGGDDHPLESFFSSPIKSIRLSDIDWGCIGATGWEVVKYDEIDDSTLAVSYRKSNETGENNTQNFYNTVTKKEIEKILKEIDEQPYALPVKNELEVTQNDLDLLPLLYKNTSMKMDITQWDSLSDSVFSKSVLQASHNTYTHLFHIQISNKNRDTIDIISDIGGKVGYALPWNIFYKNTLLINANINLLKKIDQLLPEDFMNRHIFDNHGQILLRALDTYEAPATPFTADLSLLNQANGSSEDRLHRKFWYHSLLYLRKLSFVKHLKLE
jgi:hypothetical protein